MYPLELIASVLATFPQHDSATKKFFDTYDRFVGMLLHEETRTHLEKLHSDNCSKDPIYLGAKSLRWSFQDAISNIFLEKASLLGEFTIRYGVF
jgi:hypothetical protein